MIKIFIPGHAPELNLSINYNGITYKVINGIHYHVHDLWWIKPARE